MSGLRLFSAPTRVVFAVLIQAVACDTGGASGTPPASAPATQPQRDVARNWYVPPLTLSARRETEPPRYVRPISERKLPGSEGLNWLLFGIEQRTRFELRDDDYLRALEGDSRFLLRTRGYLGIQDVLDPFRFGVEFQDSRQFGTDLPLETDNVNESDLLQAFGELYFRDAAGPGRPLRIQAGRLAIDYVDRRLRSRNGFRNTTNAFDGFRVVVGEEASDWQLDVFAVQPVAIRPFRLDRPNEERWFYGVVGSWRRWRAIGTFEPYYFVLDDDFKNPAALDGELHTLGVHAYGPVADTRFDYDVDVAFQFGPNPAPTDHAFAAHGELGYSFDHHWAPRFAAWCNYATGDRDPFDRVNERFNRMFGSSNGHYGFLDDFVWQNMINPALEVRIHPSKPLQLAALYRLNWLASDTDAWVRPGRRDRGGRRGDFVGQEIDLFLRYDLTARIRLEIGYAHMIPGDFIRNTGPDPDSDLFFIQTLLTL